MCIRNPSGSSTSQTRSSVLLFVTACGRVSLVASVIPDSDPGGHELTKATADAQSIGTMVEIAGVDLRTA